MATDKKSFVLYSEFIETFEALSDEDAGKLVKHLFKYVNDQNPQSDSPFVNLAFIPIKQALKRDLKKYENYIEKQSVNGAKGGRPPKPKKTQKTQAFNSEPKKADIVIVNDNVIDNVNVNTDDDVLHNIDANFKRYIANDKLIKAVIDNNGFRSETELKAKLKQFNQHLASRDQFSKTWKDYTSHFINWNKINKSKNSTSPTNISL